jgi:hypothetical protein
MVMVLALTVNNTRQFTGAQSHSGYTFECFHIADAGFRERRQFEVNLRTRRSSKFTPLADSGGRECDLFHPL